MTESHASGAGDNLDPTENGGDIQEVRRVRSFEGIVDQIRRAIFSGRYLPGSRFASERDLAKQLGVSRTTLREALRALESEGLVEVRLGSGGGIFVSKPSAARVGKALDSMLVLRRTNQWEIEEFRRDFESQNASLAARRATHEDMEVISNSLNRLRAAMGASGPPSGQLDRLTGDVHIAIAAATHNDVRLSIMMALIRATSRVLAQRPNSRTRRVYAHALADYEDIVAAIALPDPDRAAALMLQRLNHIS
ncbi:FadR/GntR family transcriptional regulator [Mycetocola miduiensis]|uniref:Transcriptional regulator, GntR family n=1 Tax=Mycetocola miduiensis TaxID=995034 RepID=A0A1I5AFL2_9MICO|nr:GntR family transcriptional regulator [Mycetocola miduiensis]SFN61243.1 transcriptional regulator, GntR family [Mycetocola miduiensis]